MKKRKLLIQIIVWFVIIAMAALYLLEIAFADTAIPSTPPQGVIVSDIGYESEGGQNWYTEFTWGAPTFPVEATGDKTQIFYFSKVNRGSGTLTSDVLEFSLNGTDTSLTTSGYGIDLEHGTIYEFYGRSSYTYGDMDQYAFTSGKSNTVKFLTDLRFGAELISGTNEIKIVWDDVWNTDGRIDYRILVSDTSGFTQPSSIPDIIGTDIGTANSSVTVSGDTLEYIYSNALPGREYSIKVIPLVDSDVAVIPDAELPVVRVKTDILLRAKKMGDTNEGVRWMLFWDPIIKGAIGSTTFTHVEYKLYRYDTTGKETLFALITDQDRYEMNLAPADVARYKYKVEAIAYKQDGSTVPFYSTSQVALIEQIPEYPEAPNFVAGFPTANPVPLVFDELVTAAGATLLWTAPENGEGEVDTEIYYDLYLIETLEDMDTLPISSRIASNFTVTSDNQVRELETGKLLGYRYMITQMESNAIYYAVMIAKKNFLIESEEGGYMVSTPFLSEPAVKVIVTLPDTDMDKPLAPPSPPFRLKYGEAVGETWITLQMEKAWIEMFNMDSNMRKWLYVVREDDPEGDLEDGFYNEFNSFSYEQYRDNITLNEDPDDNTEIEIPVREVEYEAGWEVMIHCVEYEGALQNIRSLKNRDFITYGDLSGNYLLAMEKSIEPVVIPDLDSQEPQAFALPIEDLNPNTTYLVWVTVMNSTGQVESDPSDPILVTTLPEFPDQVEIPVVPMDMKGIPTDTYVDLFWGSKTGYSYNIIYGTQDNRENTTGTATVSSDQLRYDPWLRIGGLQPDTLYYFWIQAVSPATAGSVQSQWSNSLIIKTEAFSPPPRPRGFGIKDTEDAVGETTVLYEWIEDESVTYILEISETADFAELTEYSASGYEYQAAGLKSNFRYFARLFAYSSSTRLRSEPTPVVMVVTRKGRGEYDADVPLEDIPVGEMVVKDAIAVEKVWNAKASGINAHRLSEKIRQLGRGTFSIDLTNPPPNTKTIRLELDGEVLETLSGINENLLIRTPGFEMIILPGSFLQDTYFRLKQSQGSITVRVDIRTPASELKPESNSQFLLPVTEMKVLAGLEDSFMGLGEFTRPIKVTVPVEPVNVDKIRMRGYDSEKGKWDNLENTWLPEEEKIAAYPQRSLAIATTTTRTGIDKATIGTGMEQTLQGILSIYGMPSLTPKALNPDKELTVAEGLMLLMDIIPYESQKDTVVEKSIRAGLLPPQFQKGGTAMLRRDEAVYAAMMILRKKTGQDITAGTVGLESFEDTALIHTPYRQAMAFAVSNGILIGEAKTLAPQRTITQAELLIMILRILDYSGEL